MRWRGFADGPLQSAPPLVSDIVPMARSTTLDRASFHIPLVHRRGVTCDFPSGRPRASSGESLPRARRRVHPRQVSAQALKPHGVVGNAASMSAVLVGTLGSRHDCATSRDPRSTRPSSTVPSGEMLSVLDRFSRARVLEICPASDMPTLQGMCESVNPGTTVFPRGRPASPSMQATPCRDAIRENTRRDAIALDEDRSRTLASRAVFERDHIGIFEQHPSHAVSAWWNVDLRVAVPSPIGLAVCSQARAPRVDRRPPQGGPFKF